MGQIRQTAATVCLINCDPKQTQVPHLTPEIGWKHIVTVYLASQRFDPVLRPPVHAVAQRVYIFA
jgi:hypothetical protein